MTLRSHIVVLVCVAACGARRDYSPFRLPDTLPSSLSPFADNEDAAHLGFQIFFDARFSVNQETRCATCHAPELGFAARNTKPMSAPSIFNAAREPVQFWDGRVATLLEQPADALLHEMGADEAWVTARIRRSYLQEYEALFGPIGADVNVHVSQALEAYMRKVASGPARLDRFIDGDRTALSEQEVRGLDAFIDKCASCHSGPTLGSAQFFALAELSVKTPTLRNIARTAPYFHDGRFSTLEEAIAAHALEVNPDVVAFLLALDGDYPPPPWNNWPAN